MRILVTGGAGYIGSAASEALLAAGHAVTVFDNLSHGHRAVVPTGARFVHGDLADRGALEDLLGSEPHEAVMHFAAYIEAGESMRQPGAFFANNVAGSLNLIEASVRHGVQRFVLSSTAGRRDAPRLVAASGKIRRELGWQPRFPALEDIIASYGFLK